MTDKKKIVHVVGGGFNQTTLVLTAKSMGLEVLVTDYYENPPCRELADYFERIDTTDKEGTLEAAKQYKVDYVVTDQTDVAVPTVAYIAESLGLKGIGYEKALAFTNKYITRKELSDDFKDHIPEYYYFDELNKATDFAKGFEHLGSYIVKPINSQGSKGVNILEGGDSLSLISQAFEESKGRGVIIEKFIPGFEFSVEAFVKDGQVYNMTLTKKYHYADNPCLDERNTYLGDISLDLEARIFDLNTRVIQKLGLDFGMVHSEFKVDKDKIYLIETAARGAGGSITSHIIPYLTGFNPTEGLLKILAGEDFEVQLNDYKEKFAILRFYNFPPGKVKKIYVDEGLTNQALVFSLDVEEGDELGNVKDSRNRAGYFIVASEDRESVLKLEEMLECSVDLEYEGIKTTGFIS